VPPVNQQTFINVFGFSTAIALFHHLNKGEWVVVGANFAGKNEGEPSKRVSELGVIKENEITLFVAVKCWTAA
jgi:hypothetical protein